jgi:hypothetical protein
MNFMRFKFEGRESLFDQGNAVNDGIMQNLCFMINERSPKKLLFSEYD